MINGNGRPINRRKQVQFMVALTILAWATETLRHQWCFGSDASNTNTVQADAPRQLPPVAPTGSGDADDAISDQPAEKFMPSARNVTPTGTLELRTDATITGSELTLKQICRWTNDDQGAFAPLADFIVTHLKPGEKSRSISISQLRKTLQDARVNLAAINLVGASVCKVIRSDVGNDQHGDLSDWIDSKQPIAPAATASAVQASATIPATDGRQSMSLRDKLINDVAMRLHVPAEQLQMEFRPQDEKALALCEPQFRFDVQPIRVRNLGNVSWEVTILADKQSQKLTIDAVARAWQNQLVVSQPLSDRQTIRDGDIVERRTMVDTLPTDTLLTKEQLLNQQASQDLHPGQVLTARMVEAVPMVHSGELVTVTLTQGTVQIKTVARAMENGAYGQSIRVRNETTHDVYQVTMTGPQAASMEKSN